MQEAAANLEFEEAGRLRDEIRRLENEDLGLINYENSSVSKSRSREGRPGVRKTGFVKKRRTT